jgi:hypothetical protein
MQTPMNTENIENINNLSDKERYSYLIQQIVKNHLIWLLEAEDGSFAMFEDANGLSYIPVWPDKEFAANYAVDDWDGYHAESMSLNEFLEWMKELKEDEILIGAFPNSDMHSLAADPIEFKNQIIQAGKNKI